MRSDRSLRRAHSTCIVSRNLDTKTTHNYPTQAIFNQSKYLRYLTAPPKFTVRPKSQISELGREAIFECHATGSPKPTLFWSVEGNRTLMFAGSRYGNIDITQTPEGRSVLSIARVQRTDSGTIIVCSAVNSVGSVSSRVVLAINTQEERPPPIILTGPVNQTLPLKSVAVLPCRASGTPTPVISWYRDGIPVLQTPPRIEISAESGTLTLNDLRKDEDAGLYTCVASSRSGKSTWSAYLKLEQPTNPNIKFYRAPDANAYPSVPGKPQIVEKNSTAVSLSWTRSGQIGASSVLGYSVEMFGRNDTDGWTTVASRLQNTTYTHAGLTAGVTYYFVVRAENSHGVSSPSAMSEPIVVGLVSVCLLFVLLSSQFHLRSVCVSVFVCSDDVLQSRERGSNNIAFPLREYRSIPKQRQS